MPTQCLQDYFLLHYHSLKVCSFGFSHLNTMQISASQGYVILEGIMWTEHKFTMAPNLCHTYTAISDIN